MKLWFAEKESIFFMGELNDAVENLILLLVAMEEFFM